MNFLLGWLIASVPSIWFGFISPDAYAAYSYRSEGIEFPAAEQIGIASRFGDPGDKWIGGTLACKPSERVSASKHQCAHRSYPCGTILVIRNKRTKETSWCKVMDRGPYGASVYVPGKNGELSLIKKAWYIKKRKSHNPPISVCQSGDCVGRWRGIIDLSPAVSDSIGHNGFEKVSVWRFEFLMRRLEWIRELSRIKKSKKKS